MELFLFPNKSKESKRLPIKIVSLLSWPLPKRKISSLSHALPKRIMSSLSHLLPTRIMCSFSCALQARIMSSLGCTLSTRIISLLNQTRETICQSSRHTIFKADGHLLSRCLTLHSQHSSSSSHMQTSVNAEHVFWFFYKLYSHIYLISITTVIQIHNTGQLCCSGTNSFISFWLQFFDTRRDTILTMLTPPQHTAHLVVVKISVGRDPKILTQWPNPQLLDSMAENSILSAPIAENSTVCLHGPISTFNWLFFKNLKFSGPSLPGMTSSTLQPHFLSGVYYDNGDISFAREHKTVPNDCAPELRAE